MVVPDLFKSTDQKTITAGHIEKVEVSSQFFGSVFTRGPIQILPTHQKPHINPLDARHFFPNSCRRQINFSHVTARRRINFRKLPPGARLFFESEKRRDPSRAFIPLTK